MTSAEPNIREIAERIAAMRELCGITAGEMASVVGKPEEEYLEYESGTRDFSFTFLYKCAERFGIDMVELLTGDNPHLSGFTLVRSGQGLPMKRRIGFQYQHLASNFKNKLSEPFVVFAPYIEEDQTAPIRVSTHAGQEFDYILEGTLRFSHDGRVMDLGPGDSVYYDSGKPHGMFATSAAGCRFIAVVMRGAED
ncbi:MAG: cupin domain-containing protein [Candidatus Methanomethylophilaceae archaeon]|nr:cupin domain-containing protein [Candidatus Methanomethylophilaceae archaeon]